MTTAVVITRESFKNLFFATLNQRMGKDANGVPYRAFAKDEGFKE